MMNERVMHEIADTDPKDTSALTVLAVRLKGIDEFQMELMIFMDNWKEVLAQRELRAQRENERLAAGEYDPVYDHGPGFDTAHDEVVL